MLSPFPLARLRNDSGQSTVELALILPVLCLLLFGILDLSTAFKYANDLEQTAAAGARMGAVSNWPNKASTSLTDYIKTQLPGDPAKRVVCVSTTGEAGDPVEVRTSYSYPLIQLVGDAVGKPSLALEGSATMRLEVALAGGYTAC